MSRWTSYGPGDACTWGAYSGHANDPRGPGIEWDDDEDEGEPSGDDSDDQAAACSPSPSASMSGV
jgi:hypothetical protein